MDELGRRREPRRPRRLWIDAELTRSMATETLTDDALSRHREYDEGARLVDDKVRKE